MKHSRLNGKKLCLTGAWLALTLGAFAAVSCKSAEVVVPDDDREIVQMAQTAYDSGNKKLAEFYYQELIRKYGDDPSIYIEGRYELAHMYVKDKAYAKAVPMLDEILAIYDNVPPGSLPGEYRKLAQKDLDKIPVEKQEAVRRQLAQKAAAEQEKTATEPEKAAAAPENEAVPESAAAEQTSTDAEAFPEESVFGPELPSAE